MCHRGTVNGNIANGGAANAGMPCPNAEAVKNLCGAAVYDRFRFARFQPKLIGWQWS